MPKVHNKQKIQADKTLSAHLASMDFRSVEVYQRWCAENGFSRRTKKNARERSLEFSRRAGRLGEHLEIAKDPFAHLSYQDVSERILLGRWGGQPCRDRKQQCLRDAVQLILERNVSDQENDSMSLRLQQFQRLYDLVARTKMATEYRVVRGRSTYVGALAALASRHAAWIRDPENWKPRSKNPQRALNSLVDHLLVVHEIPKFLYQVWREPDSPESAANQRVFVHVAAGHSIRQCKLPVKYSRSMSHFFMRAPESMTVSQAIRWGQLRAMSASPRVASAIVATQLGYRFGNEEFWRSVIIWLIKNPMLDVNEIGPIVDYLSFRKFGQAQIGVLPVEAAQPNLSMKGRTVESVLRAVNAWHDQINNRAVRNHRPCKWKPCSIKPFDHEVGVSKQKRWTIHQLLSSHELLREGQAMKHCVGSYAQSCATSATTIWSMQVHTDGLSERRLTIEVRPSTGAICQARGKANRMPKESELKLLGLWAQNSGLNLMTNLA